MLVVGSDLCRSGDAWFHPLFVSFLSLSLARNSLFIHAGLLTFLSAFAFDGMELSLTWMRRSFYMKQISWACLPSEASSPEIILSRSLKMLKLVLTRSIIVSSLFTLLSAPRLLNSSQGCLWLSDSLLVLMRSIRAQLLAWRILSSV